MKLTVVAIASALLSQTVCADATNSKQQKAIAQLSACQQSNNVASHACKKAKASTQFLITSYRQGDKSVLPALLRESTLGEFYDESVVSDPEGFLAELTKQPDSRQQSVARSMAGMFGLPRSRFDAVRAALTAVPNDSPNYSEAQRCLRILEASNASFLVNYFPPGTFSGRAAEFMERWYTRELYALGEKPIWPASDNETQYRFTWLRSFHQPVTITLVLMPDGMGLLGMRATTNNRSRITIDRTQPVAAEDVGIVLNLIAKAQFWQMPTQIPDRGFDGSEWILEGAKNGSYHMVTRWCAGHTPLGKAALKLISLSGYKLSDREIY